MGAPAHPGRAGSEHAYGPQEASGVGVDLRHAREQRGLSLDELSHRTKITVKILDSLETNRLDKLPEPIFVRGFLRAYAREVGLDPEETVQRYLAQFPPVEDPVESEAASPQSPVEPGGAVERALDAFAAASRDRRARGVLVAVVLILFAGYLTIGRRTSGPSQPAAARASASAESRPEIGTSGSTASTSTATVPDVLHLTVRARRLCWFSAIVDGTQVVHRLLSAGETYSVDVRDEASLRVGDPAAFAFAINGAEGRPLGADGEAVTVRITRQNYREFLENVSPVTGR